MKRILITGVNGYIGKHLKNYLEELGYDVFGLDLKGDSGKRSVTCDITHSSMVNRAIKRIKPGIIIHTAGLSNLSACENDPKFTFNINAEGTRNIAVALKKYAPGAKLIFFSTDYVFAGEKGGYSESDKPVPGTIYGKSKLLAEDIIRTSLRNYAIIRTANVFGDGGNFYNALVRSLTEGNKFKAFSDVYFTPTYVGYLLDSISQIIERDLRGLFHIAGRERVSRYQFAKKFAGCLNKSKLISACRQPKGGLFAKDSSLDSRKTSNILCNYSPSLDNSFKYALGIFIYPYTSFVDKRGMILGIAQDDRFGEMNYIESKKGAVRGGHFHKKSKETFFIIKGKIKVILKSRNKATEFIVGAGDVFCVSPGEFHLFKALTNSAWINMYDRKIDRLNPDIHKA